MSAITQLLDNLADGSQTLAEVAADFEEFDWETQSVTPDDAEEDSPPVDDSFDEVQVDARLTARQYARLADAYRTAITEVNPDEIFTAASNHWKNQPRVSDGENAGQWTESPGASGVSKLKKVVSAVIYKKHSDGAVVAQRGDRRLRWDAGTKKYAADERENGGWIEKEKLTKAAAYAEMKNGDWHEPSNSGASKVMKPDTEVKLPATASAKKIASLPTPSSTESSSELNDLNVKIEQLTLKIDELTKDAKPHRDIHDAVTHKAGKGAVLTKSDIIADSKAQKQLVKISAEAKQYADEKLKLLIERDGAPWGGDALDMPTAKPMTKMLPGVDKEKWNKTRDSYVVNDRLTVENNASLRSGDPLPKAKSWRSRMNKMVNASTLNNDAVVYRGAVLPPEVIMNLRPGTTLLDRGIISTDVDKGTADFYARTRASSIPGMIYTMFHIKASRGTPAADVDYGEFVFGSDSKLKILKTELTADGKVNVFAELES